MEATLEAYIDDHRVFSSSRNWLHPIFDLEQVLEAVEYDTSELEVYDRVVGLAAAFLFINLRIKHLYAGVLSTPAQKVLDAYNIAYNYHEMVDRIECKTEGMLLEVDDVEEGVKLLREYVGNDEY